MTSRNPEEIIQEALALDGKAETLQNFYAKWAAYYDEDVATEQYAAPSICVGLLLDQPISRNKDLSILDAGCGTGLIGSLLSQKGFSNLDGFDLSHKMVEQAQKLNVYRQLLGGIDLNQPQSPFTRQSYDVVICCGVFTLGHVPPQSLEQLWNATQPGGIVITSTRTRYYEESNYQQTSDGFIKAGRVKLLNVLQEAPYTTDDRSHYWVYRVNR